MASTSKQRSDSVPELIEHPDYRQEGGGYFTGTEWELEEAAQAWERSGHHSPHLCLFKCTRQPAARLARGETDFSQAGRRLDAQRAEVARYLARLAERYGSHPNEFASLGQLEQILRRELRARVSALLEAGVSARSDAETDEAKAAAQPPKWEGSPYRGLEPFEAVHAPVFFGRAAETRRLVETLTASAARFVLVAGAPGTGKSSLVAAGLLPTLEQSAWPNGRTWQTFRFTPAAASGSDSHHDPFVSLANALRAPLGFTGAVERLAERCRQAEGFLNQQVNDATKDFAEGTEWLFSETFAWTQKCGLLHGGG